MSMEEHVAVAVRRNKFVRTRRNLASFDGTVTEEEIDDARAAIAAMPLAELVAALRDIDGMIEATLARGDFSYGLGQISARVVAALKLAEP